MNYNNHKQFQLIEVSFFQIATNSPQIVRNGVDVIGTKGYMKSFLTI